MMLWLMGWSDLDIWDGLCGWSSSVRRSRTARSSAIIQDTKSKVQENIPLAVDTLSLVLADDYVTEGSAILKDKDSVLLATLNLVVACAVTTVVLRKRQC